MIRNLLTDALALVGIFAVCFVILFAGYGFSNDEGLAYSSPVSGVIFGR